MVVEGFVPEVTRIDKIHNRHGIENVIYYYPVKFKQREFIEKIIKLFENSVDDVGISKQTIYILTQLRRIRRTKEYTDEDRELLSEIRNWYIRQSK